MDTLRHSLRLRLAVILVGITAGTVIVGILINNTFLGNYFTVTKQEELIDLYDTMNRVFMHDEESDAVVYNSDDAQWLRTKCYNLGIQIIVIDTSYKICLTNVSSTAETDSENLLMRIREIIFEADNSNRNILERRDNYEVYIYTDMENRSEYMEMYGELDCGYLFLLRITNESIQEIVSIANRFYLNVGVIIMMIGILLMGFIAERFTRPIRLLADVSKRMSNLEFGVKYTGKSNDEIGILGESMNEMSDALEKTISELKAANNELRKDIEKKTEIDELRKEFISNVSHELKTPIAIIQGYAEGLKESVNDDADSRDFYCDVIVDEAAKMNKMVKKLLTLNQIEFGNIQAEYERFDIVQTIDNILIQTQVLLSEKDATVDFDNSRQVYVWSDEFQIEEVITNYISNAINHLANEKIIRINVVPLGKTVRVSVENTGEHIPEESLERIWDKFYKVDKARTREYGGSGVGLSIVKAIMKSVNMSCGVSNTACGVEFWFEVESGYEIK